MAIKRKKHLYEENIKKNKENQKGGKIQGRGGAGTGGGSKTNPANLGGNNKVDKKSTKKMTGKERAQAMAKKRIASKKTIADVKAANKLKIKKRAAEKYAAFKKKRNKK